MRLSDYWDNAENPFSIFHFPFVIAHRGQPTSASIKSNQYQMKDDKWKMENNY